jgi:hypothetical protein
MSKKEDSGGSRDGEERDGWLVRPFEMGYAGIQRKEGGTVLDKKKSCLVLHHRKQSKKIAIEWSCC